MKFSDPTVDIRSFNNLKQYDEGTKLAESLAAGILVESPNDCVVAQPSVTSAECTPLVKSGSVIKKANVSNANQYLNVSTPGKLLKTLQNRNRLK